MSAIGKAADARTTATALAAYSVLAGVRPALLQRLLVIAEATAAILLVISPMLGAIAAAGILGVAAIAMTVDLVRGDTHACGCGGPESPISWSKVIRNVVVGLSVLACAAVAQAIVVRVVAVIAMAIALTMWRTVVLLGAGSTGKGE